jgi:DNA-directed RNA polymerase specialized sigma54-like protein
MRRGILRTGVTEMNVATVLRVFKNSSLVTDRGEFKISRVFDNAGAASKARYRYHCTESGVAIYSRSGKKGKATFAVIDQ